MVEAESATRLYSKETRMRTSMVAAVVVYVSVRTVADDAIRYLHVLCLVGYYTLSEFHCTARGQQSPTHGAQLVSVCPKIESRCWGDNATCRFVVDWLSSAKHDGVFFINVICRCYSQGRNFGLKSGGTNSEGETRRKGRRIGRKYSPPYPTLESGKARSGRSPAENGFIVI